MGLCVRRSGQRNIRCMPPAGKSADCTRRSSANMRSRSRTSSQYLTAKRPWDSCLSGYAGTAWHPDHDRHNLASRTAMTAGPLITTSTCQGRGLTTHIQQVQEMSYRITDLSAYMLLADNPDDPGGPHLGAPLLLDFRSERRAPLDGQFSGWLSQTPSRTTTANKHPKAGARCRSAGTATCRTSSHVGRGCRLPLTPSGPPIRLRTKTR